MSNSREMRRLAAKWQQRTGWPQFLESLEITGLRGWDGQRVPFEFPIVALVGENGTGKSTVLQCAAASYRPTNNAPPERESWFASDFFPKTVWEDPRGAKIVSTVRQGKETKPYDVRLPGERWRGNPERPQRNVSYIDLRRIQPISARIGYSKLAKEARLEKSAQHFDKDRLARFSQIMGWPYESARIAVTDASEDRKVPVFGQQGVIYSGYNSGSGQTTIAEFLQVDPEQYGLVLIDEIETSLHPRAQRRLIRDLAALCKERELQIILSTHSPYVLAELPLEARLYLMQGHRGKHIMAGVSPEFAMSRMDEYPNPECDLYVEDDRARTMLREIIVCHSKGLVERCLITTYGAASVGRNLGIMAFQKRFPRPTGVFLDGDQSESPGCSLLPGGDAPEQVVFEDLKRKNWGSVADRVGRQFSDVADACSQVMSLTDHHEWVSAAASRLTLSGDDLWRPMCAEWARLCFGGMDATRFIQSISDLMLATPTSISSPIVRLPLFEQSRDAFEDQEQMI
ncbi:AAA family ATPase [Azospirillum sp. TSO22-1]|uniref:ATP-dependent nuclease n=1 Tax=Azospirillum sp. TSO22-1 TaxID=716789 RepID=UPI001304BF38|nr:AAA family ATPase [Azospirillum sp. TSO22-1]